MDIRGDHELAGAVSRRVIKNSSVSRPRQFHSFARSYFENSSMLQLSCTSRMEPIRVHRWCRIADAPAEVL